jgi:hypothetical protein
MTHEQFWQIIGSSKSASDGTKEAQLRSLQTELAQLPPVEIAEFERFFEEHTDLAYRWDLWGAAYIIRGGCSDDSFEYFRRWLISMGREVYERALQDAETLADIELGPNPDEAACFEEFAAVASQVYEEKTGEEIPYPDREYPSEPAGEEWAEERDDLARRFPRLWARYGWEL